MPQPVERQAITSLWSPKMESACVATVRAVTWNTVGSSSPAILNMFGIISSKPCDAVNVVLIEPVCNMPWTAPTAPPSLCISTMAGDGAPEILFAFGRPLIAPLGDGRGRRDGINRHRFVQAVGDVGGGFVAVNGFENGRLFHVKSMVWRLLHSKMLSGDVRPPSFLKQPKPQTGGRLTLFCQRQNVRCKPERFLDEEAGIPALERPAAYQLPFAG